MKITRWLVTLALSIIAGCGDGSGDFKDSLTFGTGSTGFALVGEATTFSLAALGGKPVAFRLESVADIDGRFLRLYFNDIANKDFTLPQAYGHITLSSFPVSFAGTYKVKAYYVKTVIDIGQETLVTGNTLTITE